MDEQDAANAMPELLKKLREYDEHFMDCGSAATLRELLKEVARQNFDAGFQLGGKVVLDSWKESAAQALLEAMGKDRGDGEINLGSAGTHFANERSA
jgi:hypothetical protein